MTQKELKLMVQEVVARCDEKTLITILRSMFRRQTASEQQSSNTVEKNGIGFTGRDAEFLSGLSKFAIARGYLTIKQQAVVRLKLAKYWRQIAEDVNVLDEWKRLDTVEPGIVVQHELRF